MTIPTILLWPLCHIPDCYPTLILKNMTAALPQDSGEKQSAEELENIIECIAIFYRMGKTKLDYVRKERYNDIKFNRTEVYFRSDVNVKSAFSLPYTLFSQIIFLRECVNSWGCWGGALYANALSEVMDFLRVLQFSFTGGGFGNTGPQ